LDSCTSSSILAPWETSAAEFDTVRDRLRRMRERNEMRGARSVENLYDKLRMTGRYPDLKAKMRWSVGGKHAAKIKANLAVESSIGAEQPDLWVLKGQLASGSDAFEPVYKLKESNEYKKLGMPSGLPALDPLMIAEREYMASFNGPGGKDSQQRFNVPAITHDKGDMKRLRLLEIHRNERDIEELAEEVVDDIKLICMDDYREHHEQIVDKDKIAAFKNLAQAASKAANNDEENNEVFVKPPSDIPIWG
jgi:hypothetical protein